MTKKFKLSTIAAVITLACQPMTTLYAAQTDTTKAEHTKTKHKAKTDKVEQIVVTGTFSGKSVRKVDASYAISTFDESDISKLMPKSTADLFKAIPGVWSESSGGVSGANVFVRGFPGGGDAPFLTVQLQGTPIFPPPTLSFLENSTLFRLDDTVNYMEALRGGPNPVISNGQPGLTTNFILKEGHDETEGSVKYSTADYGLQRLDTVLSGSLGDDLYYMIGGYIKSSPGVRDAGFNAEKGHQFTVNITKILDNGKFNIYTRQTNDHGVWYLPIPLNVKGIGNSYTQIGVKNRQETIKYGPNGTSKTFDFGKGRGWVGSVSGGSLDLDLGSNWGLVDKFGYTAGNADTYGLVPNGAPALLATVADNGSSATGAVTGKTYNGSTVVQQIGRWVVKKQIEAITNDFALTKTFDKGTFTVGFYNSSYSANDWWALGNQVYQVVAQGGETLTGIACNDNQDSCGWNYDINSVGDGKTRALYTALSYKISDKLTLDAGLRDENHQIKYSVDEGLDGVITKFVDYSKTATSWTLGANYAISHNMGVFARANSGSKMPFFDDFRDNYGTYTKGGNLIKEVSQYEFGYKLAKQNFDVYATAFWNEVKGDTFVRRPGAPAEILTNQAYGVELDVNYQADNGFSLSLNSTLQHTEITKSLTNKGNEAQRQPNWQVRMTPSYDMEFANGMFATLYGNLTAVGDRWASNDNIVTLKGYEKIDLGVIFNFTSQVKIQLAANNLTDTKALTEGDPRDPTAPNGRYILPRTINLSVSYEF